MPVRLGAAAVLAVCGDPRTPPVPTVGHVPGGQARIGLPASRVGEVTARWRHTGVERSWIEKEAPVWELSLEDFWLGRYPVTNLQYLAFLRVAGHPRRPATWYLGAYPWDRANHPVCGIAAQDAEVADYEVGRLAEDPPVQETDDAAPEVAVRCGLFLAKLAEHPRQDSNLRPAVSGLWRFRASPDYTFTVDSFSR